MEQLLSIEIHFLVSVIREAHRPNECSIHYLLNSTSRMSVKIYGQKKKKKEMRKWKWEERKGVQSKAVGSNWVDAMKRPHLILSHFTPNWKKTKKGWKRYELSFFEGDGGDQGKAERAKGCGISGYWQGGTHHYLVWDMNWTFATLIRNKIQFYLLKK